MVNTNYAAPIAHLNEAARSAGVAILPECGLDPGIDLVLYGEAQRRFDALNLINSYCGGFPEQTACDNPLKYKVSWVFEGVLASTKRDSRIIRKGAVIDIPGARQHDEAYVHEVDFPGLGTLEAIPNGNAVAFTDALGVTDTIRETGRYSLRWPGWSAFWRPLKQLGFLSEEPVDGLAGTVSPYQMMDKLVGPQIQYRRNEKDLVAMLNIFEGLKDGRQVPHDQPAAHRAEPGNRPHGHGPGRGLPGRYRRPHDRTGRDCRQRDPVTDGAHPLPCFHRSAPVTRDCCRRRGDHDAVTTA